MRTLDLSRTIPCLSLSIVILALCNPPPAFAQEEQETTDSLTVTGSRIQRSELSANSPVVRVDAEEIARRGIVNAEEIVRELPQAVAGISPGVNLGNPGVATVDLRGLGATRTLVLMDGKRFVPYDSDGVVDVNNIPASLIERVEVVTGGASAVYGSDAMAGVVNFILKKDFSGLELGGRFSQTGESDGKTQDVSLTLGGNFADGRGNAVLFMDWTDREAVSTADRGFSRFALATADGTRAGSIVDTQGTLFCFPACFLPGGDPNGDFLVSFTPQGDLVPTGSRTFNYNLYNYLQVPQERVQGSALLHYDLGRNIEAYGRFNFAQTRIDTSIAPSGTFFTREYDIPLDSPFLSAQARQVLSSRDPDDLELFGRRTTEVGARLSRNRTDAYQALVGVQGSLPRDWRWDASWQYGRSERARILTNDVDQDRLAASLAGCPSGSPTGCVPGNFFGDGNLSAAAADFISLQVNDAIYNDQQVLMASFSGTLGRWSIPGTGPIGAAAGVEYRKENSESFPDDCYSTPGCSGGYLSVVPVRNEYSVRELFGELLVPLLQERPFAYRLNFETGLRLSDYSTVGNVTAFKAGGDWAPVSPSLRIRGLYQKAVRAPNIFEFGSPQQRTLRSASGDPCSGNVGSTALRDLCIATGVPASLFTGNVSTVPGPIAGQINTLEGGNPGLEEEDSDTLTLGFVFSPQQLPGFSVQLDWYRIEIDNAIATLSANSVLNACYQTSFNAGLDPGSSACGLVNRNPITGALVGDPAFGLLLNNQNIALRKTEGLDLQLGYAFDAAALGSFDVSLLGTYALTNTIRVSEEFPERECAGFYGGTCGSPDPKLRFSQSTIWSIADFELGYQWRYLRGTAFDNPAAAFAPFRHVGDRHYVDLLMGWKPVRLAGVTLNVGINNALDKDPPLVGEDAGPTDRNSGNTYPGTFDTLGRTFFLNARKQF